jgi:hypothetical protein
LGRNLQFIHKEDAILDGLNLKITGDTMKEYFTIDKYGSFIPDPSKLRMEAVADRIKKQLNTKTGLFSRLAEIYERTDVRFTDNPLWNTPVIGAGFKLFGKRPYLSSKRADYLAGEGIGQKLTKLLEKRGVKIKQFQTDLMELHSSVEPSTSDERTHLLWQVEKDQSMTGGGFDNNYPGGVHESALDFISVSAEQIDYEDSELSKVVVEGCVWLRELLQKEGMPIGGLKPVGASAARAEQDTDGMFGWPIFAKGNDALTEDLAKRLLIESGVDTRSHVGETVTDYTTKVTYPFRVIDAGGSILDNLVISANDVLSIVILLARIQKHGWTLKNGQLVAKDGKTRSVYPNAFIPAIIEAMVMTPFLKKLKEIKASIMPSLQDKPTRVAMIRSQIVEALSQGHDYLPADWSKYDGSVKGSILATIIQLTVKPFFNASWYPWVDLATYILTYKYLVCRTDLCSKFPEAFTKAKNAAPYVDVKQWTVFGLVNGLISGAKFTHGGGSFYGEVVIHYGIPTLLGWKPIRGAQGGDDTMMGVPIESIDLSSAEKTYTPIADVAKRFSLKMNLSKQIWYVSNGEVVKVFLQDSYHSKTDIWGVGSIFRPASAVFMSERDKNLSIPEQLMAEIARMNQGADSPFVKPVVEWWLSRERYLGWLFKEYGVNGFQKLIDTIGKDVNEIAKSIGVGSFSFGVAKADLEAGTLPILPVMADVASQMEFSSEDRALIVAANNPVAEGNIDDELTDEPVPEV